MPDVQPTFHSDQPVADLEGVNDLGYYEDGVRRTLTDEQIAMFRHSEIQRLLTERRRKKEVEEDQQKRQARKRKLGNSQYQETEAKPSIFDHDATVHGRSDVQQLSYDDDDGQSKKDQPKTFEWPVLGSSK